ncbi:GNAT family N-acetyltransferase [Paenibacillus sp. HB172176]|uniref:GNAT family N-acetyltransferase n=1 Tax=Paenibacillus sp. HB172176 TaxID=2493690 RepID=UPI00143B1E08|nr:GNAT family N-acetyltransferase [Paenibacillus sp. HB172176]
MPEDISFHQLNRIEPQTLEQLSDLLIDAVEDGASVGFLWPLSREEAKAYWNKALEPGVILLIAQKNDLIVGSVQLQMAMKPNGAHRAEVCKLMVHSLFRRLGIAKGLMAAIEELAKINGRSLLVLDTRSGDPSNRLYQSLSYVKVGSIPSYALSSSGKLDGTTLYYKEI